MAKVEDVAEYILAKLGGMDTWKLQKLVYYCQAWSLVWDSKPLFEGRIEAWANGPVSPDLYKRHQGSYRVDSVNGKKDELTAEEKETVDTVLSTYGAFSGAQLSELTHRENPWRESRGNLPPGERSEREIPLDRIAEFYLGHYEAT